MINKEQVFSDVAEQLSQYNCRIEKIDRDRPWGGFFVINEHDAERFINIYFPEFEIKSLPSGKLSPKILIVQPATRLSWQFHYRRSELWKLIKGNAILIRSNTDEERQSVNLAIGEVIKLEQGERHRLIGTNTWGIVAEIWVHTDPENPSDENDIVRVQDDYGR